MEHKATHEQSQVAKELWLFGSTWVALVKEKGGGFRQNVEGG